MAGREALPRFAPDNANLIGLFKPLGPSLLRIGGNSVDQTLWVPNGTGRTDGQVASSDVDALGGFLRATGWTVLTVSIWLPPQPRRPPMR